MVELKRECKIKQCQANAENKAWFPREKRGTLQKCVVHKQHSIFDKKKDVTFAIQVWFLYNYREQKRTMQYQIVNSRHPRSCTSTRRGSRKEV